MKKIDNSTYIIYDGSIANIHKDETVIFLNKKFWKTATLTLGMKKKQAIALIKEIDKQIKKRTMWKNCKVIESNGRLLIISDELITVADFVYDETDDKIFLVEEINQISGLIRSKFHTSVIGSCKKIVAKGAAELFVLPKIPQSFIERWPKLKEAGIDEVEVEYEINQPKIDFKNRISIIEKQLPNNKRKERLFSLSELKEAFSFFAFASLSNQPYNEDELNEMFEKYLKDKGFK